MMAEVVYDAAGRRNVEMVQDDSSPFPSVIRRRGRVFQLLRTEIVSRGGEQTHTRVTYKSDDPACRIDLTHSVH
jgi:hypothetical protein